MGLYSPLSAIFEQDFSLFLMVAYDVRCNEIFDTYAIFAYILTT